MDIGSLGGETFMVAGNRVTVELALGRSPLHFYVLPATLFSLNPEGSRDDDTKQARSVTDSPLTHTVKIGDP